MRPRSVKKLNSRGETLKIKRREGGRGGEGQVEVGVGIGSGAEVVQIRSSCRGGDLAGGITDTRRGRWIPRYKSCGGCVEGINGDFKFPFRRLHRLP